MGECDLRTKEDEWADVRYLARFCTNVIMATEAILRLGLMLFVLILWLGSWIGLFECYGIGSLSGLVAGSLAFILLVWLRKRISGKIW